MDQFMLFVKWNQPDRSVIFRRKVASKVQLGVIQSSVHVPCLFCVTQNISCIKQEAPAVPCQNIVAEKVELQYSSSFISGKMEIFVKNTLVATTLPEPVSTNRLWNKYIFYAATKNNVYRMEYTDVKTIRRMVDNSASKNTYIGNY